MYCGDLGVSEFGVEVGAEVAGSEDVEGDFEAGVVGEEGGHEGGADALVSAVGDNGEVGNPSSEFRDFVSGDPADRFARIDSGVKADGGVISFQVF